MTSLERAKAALERAGYEIVEFVPTESGGYLYVNDPVQCMSGSKMWEEYRKVRIDGPHAHVTACQFIEARS